MMGRQKRVQRKLFYSKLNLDQRIPKNHILRIISKYIDFDFIYKEVKDKYGSNGNVSVPPPGVGDAPSYIDKSNNPGLSCKYHHFLFSVSAIYFFWLSGISFYYSIHAFLLWCRLQKGNRSSDTGA